jgi:hypothetical protein
MLLLLQVLPYTGKYNGCWTLNLTSKVTLLEILPVVLYGYETWSLTLRKERRLRVLENSVLREYLGLRGTRLQRSG